MQDAIRIVVGESAIRGASPIYIVSAQVKGIHPIALGGCVYQQKDSDFWVRRVAARIGANHGRCRDGEEHAFDVSSARVEDVCVTHSDGLANTLATSCSCPRCGARIVDIWELDPEALPKNRGFPDL